MLDDIRNFFGDVLSGKMKDAQIALTKQESDTLRLKVDSLLDKVRMLEEERLPLIKELEIHRLKVREQATLIADLTAKLEQRDSIGEGLDEKEIQVLQLFFDAGRDLSTDMVAQHFKWSSGEADFYVGSLLKQKFLRVSRPGIKGGLSPVRSLYGRGSSGASKGLPALCAITQEGREQVMKRRQ